MTKITSLAFTSEDNIKFYRKQIKAGTLKVIKIRNTNILIHADTFEQIEKYIQSYIAYFWLDFKNKMDVKAQDEEIKEYFKTLEREDKWDAKIKEFNITGDLQLWIRFFVREIYSQSIYYYEAVKKYPDTLPYESWIYQRWRYISPYIIFVQHQSDAMIQKESRKLRRLLSVGDKEGEQSIRKILLFTENLLSEIPYYLYTSPIMAAFVTVMFDIKKLYDLIIPNDGLPLMNKYFNNSYASLFEINFIPFDRDNPNEKPFIPETEALNDWILPDYKKKFIAIEEELFKRKFIDSSYIWGKTKKELLDFVLLIVKYKYIKPIVKGKKMEKYHYRQFFSERYGMEKTGLTNAFKKHKPTFDLLKATFHWIEPPDK